MEVSGFISAIFLAIPILIIIHRIISKPVDKSRLPPGPPKLPIIGNLHQLASKRTPPPHRLQELARVYGPIMHLQLGQLPTVVVSSAKVAKEVLRTHDVNFANRPSLMIGKELYYDSTDIGLAPYGEYWRQVRKIATLELFTGKRVQSFRGIREEEVAKFKESIAVEANACGSVNLSEKIFGLTFNLISRMVFSKIGKDREAFRELVTKMSKASSGFAIADLYPSLTYIHSLDGLKNMLKKMIQESNRILDPIIHEHKRSKTSSQVKEVEDLVDVLLNFHGENLDQDDIEFSLTTNNIKAIILEIFAAGAETTSTTVEWAMSELLKNPKAMERAQSEVRRVYEEKGKVDESRLEELKYVKLAIKETLRLHPPAPLLVPRESVEQCKIQGYDIPPKTRVIVNAYAIGRDVECWSDPNAFKPERFEGSSIDYKGNNFELIPFGAGRRMCPGMTLGVANIELPLATLLYHFDWQLPAGITSDTLNMDDLFGMTMRRKNDLYVIPTIYTKP